MLDLRKHHCHVHGVVVVVLGVHDALGRVCADDKDAPREEAGLCRVRIGIVHLRYDAVVCAACSRLLLTLLMNMGARVTTTGSCTLGR